MDEWLEGVPGLPVVYMSLMSCVSLSCSGLGLLKAGTEPWALMPNAELGYLDVAFPSYGAVHLYSWALIGTIVQVESTFQEQSLNRQIA